MDKLSSLARKFQIKLAQQADRSAPELIDPNSGPKNGAEAQARLDLMHLQNLGKEIIAEVAEGLGMSKLQNALKFTKLRFVNNNGQKTIDWAFAVAPEAVKQFNDGVGKMRQSGPTFSVARYITQLFNQKLPGVAVMPAQPISIG